MFKSVIGKNKTNLVLLHGWGTTWESLYPLLALLKPQFNLYAPNLPYPTGHALTLDDYCQFVADLIKTNKITKPVLIGHSLGGAICTRLCVTHPHLASKIILLSAATVRHELPPHLKFFQKFSKVLHPFRKSILKLLRLDASDYIVLKTEAEKQTFRNLIHLDQTPTPSQTTPPPLILWGDRDLSTPLSDGQQIHSLIKRSKFKSFQNTGHFFYLDHSVEVAKLISNFALS